MSTAVATQHKTPVAALAEVCKFTDPVLFANTVKATVFPNGQATNEQLLAFCEVALAYGLNPFLKQIYAFPSKGGGIVPMVSVDGWASIVTSHPQMNGIAFEDSWNDKGEMISTTCTIQRKDWAHPCSITEYMQECKGTSGPWQKSPFRMLRHRAMIQCARIAFGLGGVYDEDDAKTIIEAEVVPAVAQTDSLKTLTRRIQPQPAATVVDAPLSMTPEESAELDRKAAAEESQREAEQFFGGEQEQPKAKKAAKEH